MGSSKADEVEAILQTVSTEKCALKETDNRDWKITAYKHWKLPIGKKWKCHSGWKEEKQK